MHTGRGAALPSGCLWPHGQHRGSLLSLHTAQCLRAPWVGALSLGCLLAPGLGSGKGGRKRSCPRGSHRIERTSAAPNRAHAHGDPNALSVSASLRRGLLPWFNQPFPNISPPERFSQGVPLNHAVVRPRRGSNRMTSSQDRKIRHEPCLSQTSGAGQSCLLERYCLRDWPHLTGTWDARSLPMFPVPKLVGPPSTLHASPD